MNAIDLKERIAISDAYTPEERDFLLDAVNAYERLVEDAKHAPRNVVHMPPNYLGRIDHLWAVLSVDDGGEGVVAAPIGPGGMTVPLVAADKARLDSIRPMVPQLTRLFGKVLRLAKFTTREDIEVWRP